MRRQRIEPGMIATRGTELRAGQYVYTGERFDRLVRPRAQAGKGWFVQGDNPRYLGSLPQAQIDLALAEYQRLVETVERVESRSKHERARGRDIREELDYESLWGLAKNLGDRVDYGQQDDALAEIYQRQGFHGRPEVLTEAEMDQRIADGWVEVWRGFGAPPEGIGYAEAFRRGETHYAGLGVHGNGTYAAFGSDASFQASTYTYHRDFGRLEDSPRALVRMAIPPDANVGSLFDMAYVPEVRGAYGVSDPVRAARGRVFSDDGRLAAAMGYDALVLDQNGRGVYLILNRSMLAVQEAGDG
jgi:hypothetical protein